MQPMLSTEDRLALRELVDRCFYAVNDRHRNVSADLTVGPPRQLGSDRPMVDVGGDVE